MGLQGCVYSEIFLQAFQHWATDITVCNYIWKCRVVLVVKAFNFLMLHNRVLIEDNFRERSREGYFVCCLCLQHGDNQSFVLQSSLYQAFVEETHGYA